MKKKAPTQARLKKTELKAELVQVLTQSLATLERAHHDATVGATHAEAKPENDKDTRALEQSYLARGQAFRVEALRDAVAEVSAMMLETFTDTTPIGVGALVTIDEDEQQSRLFLAPHGGGSRLAGGTVQVVTPKSPLGAALIGKRVGDDSEVVVAGKTRFLEIADVS